MNKAIFTKYSTERDDKFKIVTTIKEDEEGNKWVEKRAVHKRAKPHIESLSQKYKELTEYYKNTLIQPASCDVFGSKAVFSFVNGESLEKRLDRYVEEKDLKKILDEIEKYKKVISTGVEIVPFQVCDEFIHVFGSNYPMEGVDAFRVSDIDLVFSNIIISDDIWHVIDYEWTFDFFVPVDFIVYRAVKVYTELFIKRKILTDNNIYGFLGISNQDRLIYDKMENSFQRYVLADQNPTWELYEVIRGKNIYLQDIIAKNITDEIRNEIQVFYDVGNGFREEDSYKIYQTFSRPVRLNLRVEENVKSFRIDPGMDFCIVRVMEAIGRDRRFYNVEISTNGVDMGNGCYLFPTEDPQIYINGMQENTTEIVVKIEVKILEKSFVYDLCKAISVFYDTINQLSVEQQDQNRKQEEKIAQLENLNRKQIEKITQLEKSISEKNIELEHLVSEIRQKQEMLGNYKNELDVLFHSTSWKITKPYRVLGEWIKKCLRVIK